MTTIKLNWQGSFSLDTDENRSKFGPPDKPGIYIWAVGKENDLRVSYVGQSSSIKKRMYEHIFSTLGGAYWLYTDDHFLNGDKPSVIYKPGLENILEDFIPNYRDRSVTAYRNLVLNKIFWAILERNADTLKKVESALIKEATDKQEPIQNLSISQKASEQVLIVAPFPKGLRLYSSDKSIRY